MSEKLNDRWSRDWNIPSHGVEGRQIIDQILERLEQFGWDDCEQFAIHLALEEAVSNAICHGNRNDPHKRVRVWCELCVRRFVVKIQDDGPGFDPAAVPDCTCDQNIDKPGGRGLFLMQRYMDRVCYEGQGNRLVMEKWRDRVECSDADAGDSPERT